MFTINHYYNQTVQNVRAAQGQLAAARSSGHGMEAVKQQVLKEHGEPVYVSNYLILNNFHILNPLILSKRSVAGNLGGNDYTI